MSDQVITPAGIPPTSAVGEPDIEAALDALDELADELLTVTSRAAEAATKRGDEIDGILTAIRRLRA